MAKAEKSTKEEIIEMREAIRELRTKIKAFSKTQLTEKMQGEKVEEGLKYAFEYSDETLKSLTNADFCLAHVSAFLK